MLKGGQLRLKKYFFVANLGIFLGAIIWGHPVFLTPYNGVIERPGCHRIIAL
jgi:hypothetical protein